MRNLKVLHSIVKSFPSLENVQLASQLCGKLTQFLVVHNLKISLIDVESLSTRLLFDICELIPVSPEDVSVVNVGYFTIEDLVVCGVSNGTIIKYHLGTSQAEVEDVFPGGIKALKLSPDNELLVFVTVENKVALTDCRLECLASQSLFDEHFGEGEFINVGWGKKETQFHGSEGKEAAKKNIEQVVLSDSGESGAGAAVTWRGDSALFAVSYFNNSACVFKVFDREGALQFTSETQPGLECHIAWRPSGSLIATTQKLPNKYVVALFEKNGLKHGEFSLPFQQDHRIVVKHLAWSSDSEVLCVWCWEPSSDKSLLCLYTANNYHWYLKHSLPITGELASVFWDESDKKGFEKTLHVFCREHQWARVRWGWGVDRSSGLTRKDNALVGVIDGCSLLLTSFRKAAIPPPMAGWTVRCDSAINHVIFGPGHQTSTEDHFALLLNDFTLCFFKMNHLGHIGESSQLRRSLAECWSQQYGCLFAPTISQMVWLSSGLIVGILNGGDTSSLVILTLGAPLLTTIDSTKIIPTNQQLIGLCPFGSNNQVLLQSLFGELFVYSHPSEALTRHLFSFPEWCHEMASSQYNGLPCVYGLTHLSRFYVNSVKVADNVNSFLVHSDFLLLTTLSHQLLALPLSENLAAVVARGLDLNKHNSNCFVSNRKLERGSKLIAAVPCDSRVVVQLPRGNLETIQPRPLSIHMIGTCLDNCHYSEAFHMMRKQRINLNLLYDHNPHLFVENVGEFIRQIDNISWLNLFISDLEDSDVTTTMYPSSYPGRSAEGGRPDKVKAVCQLMRGALRECNEDNKYLLTVITTHVKTNTTPDLEEALRLIKQLLSGEAGSCVSAEEALKYLLYMVDVNKLYDLALGLYDFELAMFVASKSQKDPKEYVPFLNNLMSLEPNYRHFTIDDLLKRHHSALKHLVLCGQDKEGETVKYVKKYSLYKTALKCVDRADPRYKVMAECYAQYLVAHKHFKEAAVMFMRCGCLEEALAACLPSADWNMAMHIMDTLPMDQPRKRHCQKELLVNLKEGKRYSEALEFAVHCGHVSATELIHLCFEGRLYSRVIGLCTKDNAVDLIESVVSSSALEHSSLFLSLIASSEEQFGKHKRRLAAVRLSKKDRRELGEEAVDDCDLYSDTSSVVTSSGSRASGKSFRSSKNRRKHQRKLVSVKEGSKYEEVALIRALHTDIATTFSLRRDVGDLCALLQWLDRDQDVCALQDSLELVLDTMTDALSEIWSTDLWTDLPDPNASLEPHLKIPPVIHPMSWKILPLT